MKLKTKIQENRNLVQLVTLLGLFCISPFFQEGAVGRILLNVMFTAILLAGVFSLSLRPRYYRPALAIVGLALMLNWSSGNFAGETGRAGLVLTGVFFGYILVLSFVNLLGGRVVTRETVFQSLNIYLFIGMFFAMIFATLESFAPGSLDIPSNLRDASGELVSLTFYFSFVNLTTVGFGDISPVTPVARSLGIIEAVIGQLYLAVLVARLVGLQIAHGTQTNGSK